ncbi:S8 family peptidase [Actinoplanes rectilineatus]|uniref:S8 family peptidase n=1 Tax=Actinoplanes rectilineatus TaxID=113571 RepID=UPI0005F280D1|nr:S8 family peptidase [Actinoplanes rectilineatus]
MFGRLLAGVLVGVAAIPVPAFAGAPPVHEEPAAAPVHTLTLITGDVIQIGQAADGRQTAAVTPAAGRERITFHTVEADGGLRVVPSDAIPLIQSGRVDAELFDVERLLADGYGDATTGTLPLIVSGGAAPRAAGTALGAAGTVLTSIDAVAIRPAKDTLAAFWQAQTDPSTSRTAGDRRIFLDGKVKPVLDRSAAQIGAPAAWSAGLDGRGVKVAVLDTGVDAAHPDLAGRIAATANFSSSPDVVDRFGHGTHVAATVAGSGAASGGTRKGVAYGAELLIGKVLGDDGYGYESEIIAGMQWAVGSGARIVNMSLGGSATDGLDPMSLAVDELSAASGTLFVVAAGNEGTASSVGTPGAAPSALTVGAVDRDNRIASFSSRGPRLGDLGLKPEITAPGVGIVAARAAGTAMGEPVDANYTAADGTSMATPHVAGAAAILAQQHPDWTGARLKETLVSTAVTSAGATVYDQGAGRVDLARATTQRISGTPVADFGRHSVGEEPGRVTRTVEYRNEAGTAPVTLTLQAPAAVTLSATAVTVPAGGVAAVTVTLNLTGAKPAQVSGWITATAGDVRVTTAVGAIIDGPVREVTVRAVDDRGAPINVPALTIFGDDGRFDVMGSVDKSGATLGLQDGTYIVTGLIELAAAGNEVTYVVVPELTISGDTTIVLDARKGKPIVIETPRPAVQRSIISYFAHRVTGSGRSISHGVMHFAGMDAVNTVPTAKIRSGEFEFSSRWQLAPDGSDTAFYDVFQVSEGQIPSQIKYRMTAANSMRIATTYAHNGGEAQVREQRFGWRPWQDYSWNDTSRAVRTPSSREEWVSTGDTVWQHMVHSAYPWNNFGPLQGGFVEKPVSYRPGHRTETWGGAVVRPADLGSTRTGDVLQLRVAEFVDSDGHAQYGFADDNVTVKLWRNGTLIAEPSGGTFAATTTAGKASYRLAVTTGRSGEEWVYATSTSTEWTFTSAAAGRLPLLGVDYTVHPLGVNLAFSAKVRSLKVEMSTDDGTLWRPAVVLGNTALVLPGRKPVSLRVTATDTAGNTLKQTVIRAYAPS